VISVGLGMQLKYEKQEMNRGIIGGWGQGLLINDI
jgi:hypothetical protein